MLPREPKDIIASRRARKDPIALGVAMGSTKELAGSCEGSRRGILHASQSGEHLRVGMVPRQDVLSVALPKHKLSCAG
jgi:hypothetical protein